MCLQIFNDKTQHDTTEVDTGNAVVDSFCGYTCSPKFRETFEVHRIFENYTNLRSEYETSQQYRNWIASGQNDGKHFFPNFQNQKPLHVMLHVFLEKHELSGCALSRVDAAYAYDSSAAGMDDKTRTPHSTHQPTLTPPAGMDELLGSPKSGTPTPKCLNPSEFRREHAHRRKQRTLSKRSASKQPSSEEKTPKRSRLSKKIQKEMRLSKVTYMLLCALCCCCVIYVAACSTLLRALCCCVLALCCCVLR